MIRLDIFVPRSKPIATCLGLAISVLFGSMVRSDDARLTSTKAESIVLLPEDVSLSFKNSGQNLLVHQSNSTGQILGAITENIAWTIDDPQVVKIDGQKAIAIRNGTTKIHASWQVGEAVRKATATVTVRDADIDRHWEFNNHVLPVLARNGCNMGACHGALAGKGGFRLSLRGYDPATDHYNITRQDRGRRIELTEPAKSLLIAKPSGAIEHKGGLKLPSDSQDYRLLLEWISDGAVDTRSKEPKLTSVEVLPKQVRLATGDVQKIVVLARYENGRVEDVTHWAKFSSSDESVASVDEFGKVKVLGPGEGSIGIWYASRIASARISVPYSIESNHAAFSGLVDANLIDKHVHEQLRALGIPPSPKSSDSVFVRRVYLDTVGTLPTAEEASRFLNDSSPDKRQRLIDDLLERSEFVDYWSYRWSDLLMLNSAILRSDGVKAYYQWLRGHIAKNTPWDVMVREIITARGEALVQGATNFYALNQDPESMTENACQAFLGLSIGCAKCHNHPLEKWTNDQYYAMANMFARVRAKGWGGDTRDGDAARTLFVLDRGELIQPLTGRPQLPAPLDAPPIDPNDPTDRREVLAAWMTSPENPYFTKAIVNRVWAAYFGVGIVNAVDDLRASNPASNPDLLNALSAHLTEHQYDLKELMRLILNSETYQRSSLTTKDNEKDKRFFSHYYPRRLMAEVLHDAVVQVTSIPTDFTKIEFPGADFRETKFYQKGTRAIQLYDSAVANQFLKTFGRNQRRIVCECERSDEPSVIQVLHIANGETINPKLAKEGSAVDLLIKDNPNLRDLIEKAYFSALSRSPTQEELSGLEKELLSVPKEEFRIAVEDLLWSLISSREFMFNH